MEGWRDREIEGWREGRKEGSEALSKEPSRRKLSGFRDMYTHVKKVLAPPQISE